MNPTRLLPWRCERATCAICARSTSRQGCLLIYWVTGKQISMQEGERGRNAFSCSSGVSTQLCSLCVCVRARARGGGIMQHCRAWLFLLLLSCSSGNLATCKPPAHVPPSSPPPAPAAGAAGSAAAASMNPSELEAFFQVIESLLDVSNVRSLHPRPCTQDLLPGMLCEQGGDKLMHVTRLQFGSGMSRHCKLSATIPSAISQLPFLKTLLISECIMSERTTIPWELANLANSLQELSLRSNKALVGSIPTALGRLKNLQVLSLAQNNLQGSVPGSLGSLKMLQHLDLSYNVLSGSLPPVLGALASLSIMDLSGNLLQGTIPSSFSALKALQKLDLSSNQLKGSIPTEVGNLGNLQFLALSQNAFTGPLPASLARLANLEYFLMDGNPVHGPLPSYMAGWTQLRQLSLADSYYTGPIPSDLHSLFNVSVINLSNNKLDGTIPPTLELMQQINYLNLSQNSLTGSVPFSAHFIQKLGNRLDLHGNPGLCVSAAALSFSGGLLAQQLRICDNHALTNQGASSLLHSNAPSPASSFTPPLLLSFFYLLLLWFP